MLKYLNKEEVEKFIEDLKRLLKEYKRGRKLPCPLCTTAWEIADRLYFEDPKMAFTEYCQCCTWNFFKDPNTVYDDFEPCICIDTKNRLGIEEFEDKEWMMYRIKTIPREIKRLKTHLKEMK